MHHAADAGDWLARATVLREEQRLGDCAAALDRAWAFAPGDARIAFLRAQTAYELGLPAAALFAEAMRLAPDNRDALRNRALALAAEGAAVLADALLTAALAQQPGWLEGHRVLAALRWTGGQAATFDAGLAAAARAHPGEGGLWLGWFSAVAQHRDWPRATAILDEAERHLGAARALATGRLFVAGESGDLAAAECLLAALGEGDDAFVTLARIRYHLRRRDPTRALAAAWPHSATSLAGQVWPYIGTCWRMLGDARADWLDAGGALVGVVDPGLSAGELGDLAVLLRALHTAQAPYAEQSVRAGTQTDRSLLLRHEPLLQHARSALMTAMAEFVRGLPPHDPAHPVLGRRHLAGAPVDLRISGSWSVRLGPRGFNVAHSHPAGWLSSAFYVALPGAAQMGPAPAGHLELGAPPAELGLALPPTRTIAPRAGALAIFPSITWHGTVSIAAGERLNIAFDVVPAR